MKLPIAERMISLGDFFLRGYIPLRVKSKVIMMAMSIMTTPSRTE
jgi:hypothetical protein